MPIGFGKALATVALSAGRLWGSGTTAFGVALLADFADLLEVLFLMPPVLAGVLLAAAALDFVAALASSVLGLGAACTTAAVANIAAMPAMAAVNEPLRVKSKSSPSESDGAGFAIASTAIALNMLRNRLLTRNAPAIGKRRDHGMVEMLGGITSRDRVGQQHSLSSPGATRY